MRRGLSSNEQTKFATLAGPNMSIQFNWPYTEGYVSGTVAIAIYIEDVNGLDTFVVYIDGDRYVS